MDRGTFRTAATASDGRYAHAGAAGGHTVAPAATWRVGEHAGLAPRHLGRNLPALDWPEDVPSLMHRVRRAPAPRAGAAPAAASVVALDSAQFINFAGAPL